MKIKIILAIALSSALALFAPGSMWGQGPLAPPAPPAPTMKTLQQVEPRTQITNTAAVTISQSGSYYLTGNITVTNGNAVTITADSVTIDLNGFTVFSTEASPSGSGILLSGVRSDIHIFNGHIRGNVTEAGGAYAGSGFASGISASATPQNVLVSRVSVSGCLDDGINLVAGNSTVVESATVHTVGGHGIIASTIRSSAAFDCGNTAIGGDQVSDCRGQCVNAGNGVTATTAQNCYGSSNSGDGMYVLMGQNCYGASVSGFGVHAVYTASNCGGYVSGSSWGVNAFVANNCYGVNAGNGIGLLADVANNCYGEVDGNGTGLNFQACGINCYGLAQGSGPGLDGATVGAIAIGCRGISVSGVGLTTYIANSSFGTSNNFYSVSAAYKYNMP